MENNTAPQPERFQYYTELPNGLGFTIKDSTHVFYYDRYHGWKDQFGNYYNADGKPDQQPQSESQKSISQNSWDSEEDEYQKQFGTQQEVLDQFQKQPVQTPEQRKIAKNLALLQGHVKGEPIRINFQILDLDQQDEIPTRKQIILSYRKKAKGLLNVFVEEDNFGYFVVKDAKSAVQLINLEGENIIGFDFTFFVQTFEELLADPLAEDEIEEYEKFIEIDESEKIYIVHLDNHAGFGNKALFKNWIKKAKQSLSKFEVVKTKSNQHQQRIPIIKIKANELEKLQSIVYAENEKLVIQLYTPNVKPSKYEDKPEEEKKEEEKKEEEKKEGGTESQETKVQESQ